MRTYGQYCPISRSSEILGERWTMLIVRNLLLGATGFNDIAGGLPGMSRSLLSARLRSLEEAGVVQTKPKQKRRGKAYELTDAGRELWSIVKPMAEWGERWIELQPQHTDPSFVLWAWAHVHLRSDRLPARRVVAEFYFPDQPAAHRRFWMLFEDGGAELCHAHPGFETDIEVIAESEAFTHWHVGKIEWRQAVRSGRICVEGPRSLLRALPTWNERAIG